MHQLVFYLPIAFGAILAAGAALGLLEGLPDAEVELDLDVDVDADVDVDLDAEAEADGEGEVGAGPGLGAALLTFLGVGRAPLGILVMSACFLFGVVGLAFDRALEALLGSGAAWVGLSAALAAVVTALGTGAVGRGLGRLVPSKETYASRKTDLLGRAGTAALPTDGTFGRARVTDAGGAVLEVRCRTIDEEALARGEPLVVVDFDEEEDTYLVARMPS